MTYFVVQQYTICDGWVNTWTVDGKPEVFSSLLEAEAAISEYIKDWRRIMDGDMEDAPSRDEFRIVEIAEVRVQTK